MTSRPGPPSPGPTCTNDVGDADGSVPLDTPARGLPMRRLGRLLATATGFALQAVAGVVVSSSGMFMPLWAIAFVTLVWFVGTAVALRSWRDHRVVVAVPVATLAIWIAVSWAGLAILGWTPR